MGHVVVDRSPRRASAGARRPTPHPGPTWTQRLNEFVAFSSLGPQIPRLQPKTVLVSTFALAGFANFSSIAIQIGVFGGLAPERRGQVAKFGLLALLAGSLANLTNAAIVGIVAS